MGRIQETAKGFLFFKFAWNFGNFFQILRKNSRFFLHFSLNLLKMSQERKGLGLGYLKNPKNSQER